MALQILPLQSTEIPVSKIFNLAGSDYEFRFQYNKRFDFLTVEIWQEGIFQFSSKLCYGNNILKGFKKIPFAIVPLTEDDLYVENYSGISVNLETIGKSVNLYFEDRV
jgi:hypothetical protein